MKKVILLILFCSLFAKVKAQDSVYFKIKYLANHKYSSSLNLDSRTEMNIYASKEIMDKIQAKGIKLPMLISGKTIMAYEIQTGSINQDKIFPVVINYTNIHSTQTINGVAKDGPQSPLINLKIYAHGNENSKMTLDSIPGKGINDTLKSVISNMINKLQDQTLFPTKTLKPGDTFTCEVPMSMPIEGNTFQIIIKITYTLVDIKNNIANFNLDEKASLSLSMKFGTLNMIGQGSGKMVFDIKNSFASNITTNLKFDYTMPIENMSIKGTADITSIHDTTIE